MPPIRTYLAFRLPHRFQPILYVSLPLLSLLFSALIISGCAALPSNSTTASALSPEVSNLGCYPALQRLDQMAAKHAGSFQGERITGAPWLRNSRFLSSYFQETLNQQKLDALISRMTQLAQHSLLLESEVLPPHQLKHWQQQYAINTPLKIFLQRCAQQAITQQLATPQRTQNWLRHLPADDDYSTLARWLGFYPLAAIPFRYGVVREQQELKAAWGKIADKQWFTYRPQKNKSAQATLPQLPLDALGIPQLNKQTEQVILKNFAPDWRVESNSAANRPGSPFWRNGQLQTDIQTPTTFSFISPGRVSHKHPATLQLNYVIWFSERPKLSAVDWVAGQHDAVIFRIHLTTQYEVLAYDSIHLCGCWYRLFIPPNSRFQPEQPTSFWQEPVSVQTVQPATRMAVYLSRDTHQVVNLQPARNKIIENTVTPQAQQYALRHFDDLLRLPIFNKQGYVPGSERLERWLFWPMGVKNPGALRRFGDHAINFIGRRHFDEPRILQQP